MDKGFGFGKVHVGLYIIAAALLELKMFVFTLNNLHMNICPIFWNHCSVSRTQTVVAERSSALDSSSGVARM